MKDVKRMYEDEYRIYHEANFLLNIFQWIQQILMYLYMENICK